MASEDAVNFMAVCGLLQQNGYKMLVFSPYASFEQDPKSILRAIQSVVALVAPSLWGYPRTEAEQRDLIAAVQTHLGTESTMAAASALPGGADWLTVHRNRVGIEPLLAEESVVTYARRCASDCGRAMHATSLWPPGTERLESEYERLGARWLSDPDVGPDLRRRFYPWDPHRCA